MKTRVLFYSTKGKMESYAEEIARLESVKSDKIPPAYSCDKEKIVFLGLSVAKDIPDQLRLFLNGMDKTKASNVAFFIDGKKEHAQAYIDAVKNAGANVLDNVLYVNIGMFSFGKALKPEEKTAITDWANEILRSIDSKL
ncbi:MAG: flavodoxin family protein [Ruminococcaceae bacterium]|nr:flavodoxin family protein [Oscillospiraceae bacterium]